MSPLSRTRVELESRGGSKKPKVPPISRALSSERLFGAKDSRGGHQNNASSRAGRDAPEILMQGQPACCPALRHVPATSFLLGGRGRERGSQLRTRTDMPVDAIYRQDMKPLRSLVTLRHRHEQDHNSASTCGATSLRQMVSPGKLGG